MQIVIELDDEMYKQISTNIDVYVLDEVNFILIENAIANGTPLPKGHGRLIDEDALEFTCNADECGMLTGCNHCQYHIVTEHEIDNAPTIIASDKED